MSRAVQYGRESLASAGFVIWDTRIAMRLRPDLWPSGGLECNHDFVRLYSRQVVDHSFAPGCHELMLNLDDVGLCKVLTRSLDQLETRITWLTGFRVLPTVATNVRASKKSDTPPAPEVAAPVRKSNGDVYEGTTTKEAGRTCSTCENVSPGSTCTKPQASGIEVPAINAIRRCPAYQPGFKAMDDRPGLSLWPELKLVPVKEATHGCV